MKIDQQTYATWMDTLTKSREDMFELSAFGLYLPKEDRVLHTVRPEELPEGSVIKSTPGSLDFHDDLKAEIKAFNERRTKNVTIGSQTYSNEDGKVYSYHTHPADDHEVRPSKFDSTEMLNLSSPLEIILAGALLQHLPKKPFVVGYHLDYFPEGERDLSKLNPFNGELEKEAEEMGISSEILSQLILLKHYTGLQASMNIEVE